VTTALTIPRVPYRALLVLSIVVIGLWVLSVCGRAFLTADRPQLEVIGTWWTPAPLAYGMKSVSGRIRNNSNVTFVNITVEVELLSANGDSIGSRQIALRRLGPRETREFTTWLLPNHPSKFRVRSVYGQSYY
jgi:hypothetical protein